MTVGGRAKLGLFVSLGILAGIVFVGLPGLLLTPTHYSAPATTSGTSSTSGNTAGMSATPTILNGRSNTTGIRPTPAGDTQVTPGSLAALISLVVAPAVAISLVATVFVSRLSSKRANSLAENP